MTTRRATNESLQPREINGRGGEIRTHDLFVPKSRQAGRRWPNAPDGGAYETAESGAGRTGCCTSLLYLRVRRPVRLRRIGGDCRTDRYVGQRAGLPGASNWRVCLAHRRSAWVLDRLAARVVRWWSLR